MANKTLFASLRDALIPQTDTRELRERAGVRAGAEAGPGAVRGHGLLRTDLLCRRQTSN